MFKSRCGQTSTKTTSSLSSRKCDCSSLFSSKQVGNTARLPAYKRRCHGDPDISLKECNFWYSGHGRWCYECRKNAHYNVLIPTHKHSSSHRACAHKIDSGRLRVKSSECAHSPVPTYTAHSACLPVSVKTKPKHTRSQTQVVFSASHAPAVARPHALTDMSNPEGSRPLASSQLPAVTELSAGKLPAVISTPPASSAANTASMFQHIEALQPPHCHGQSANFIQPLAIHATAWAQLPGVSEWVLNIIKRGYSLQFARRPRRCEARVETTVKTEVAHLLRAKIAKLLSKGAIEPLSLAQSEGGLYSRYFLVPKKDGGLRPILDLRQLNKALQSARSE